MSMRKPPISKKLQTCISMPSKTVLSQKRDFEPDDLILAGIKEAQVGSVLYRLVLGGNLYCMVEASGEKFYEAFVKIKSKKYGVVIGDVEVVSLDEAKEVAKMVTAAAQRREKIEWTPKLKEKDENSYSTDVSRKIDDAYVRRLKIVGNKRTYSLGRLLYVKIRDDGSKRYYLIDKGFHRIIDEVEYMTLAQARIFVEEYIACKKRGEEFHWRAPRRRKPLATEPRTYSDIVNFELEEGKSSSSFSLGGGLNVLVQAGGKRKYFVQINRSRMQNKIVNKILGEVDDIPLSVARAITEDIQKQMDLQDEIDIDLIVEKRMRELQSVLSEKVELIKHTVA